MAPSVKEPEQQNSASHVASASQPKVQPVALEISVTGNGVRTVEGSDKREPFSETTQTVLVFGTGAVIRLNSPVAPGQLLFLTNEKTKKEVVCQVVKSKNYRNVSGYVELEFTEPLVGFWGMRFPGDKIASQPAAPSAASPVSSGSTGSTSNRIADAKPSVVPGAQPPVTPKPQPSTNATQENASGSVLHFRRASDNRAVTAAQDLESASAPVSTDSETEALKLQA